MAIRHAGSNSDQSGRVGPQLTVLFPIFSSSELKYVDMENILWETFSNLPPLESYCECPGMKIKQSL